VVAQVSAREPAMQSLHDGELQALTRSFRARLQAGETLAGLRRQRLGEIRLGLARRESGRPAGQPRRNAGAAA
jgi:preprotein translocase subunit SecA